jgi:hypothetical protein
LLAFTGFAKLISSLGTARILNSPDALFHISFGRIFQLAAVVELCVAAICFLNKNRMLQAGLIALLSSNFLLYRIGLYWEGYHGLCHCLGNLTDALHISPQTADTVMKIILAYLLIGSYITLFWLWTQRARITPLHPT